MARLSTRDATAWADLARRAAPGIEARLAPTVIANRVSARDSSVRIAALGPVLRRGRLVAARLAVRSSLVIRTDVRSFYPSISGSMVHRALLDADADRILARTAAEMVDGWASDGHPGLPIGPPPSAVLANAVLAPADDVFPPARSLRWVDDYLIGLPVGANPAFALEALDERLARIGLQRSEEKTAILDGGRPIRWPGASGTYGPPRPVRIVS